MADPDRRSTDPTPRNGDNRGASNLLIIIIVLLIAFAIYYWGFRKTPTTDANRPVINTEKPSTKPAPSVNNP